MIANYCQQFLFAISIVCENQNFNKKLSNLIQFKLVEHILDYNQKKV